MRTVEIKDRLVDAMSAIESYPHAAGRARQYFDLADVAGDGVRDPYDAALDDLGRLIAAARKSCREIKALKGHTHQWNGNDYCNLCGADGRA